MSSPKNKNSNTKVELKIEEDIYNIKIFRRTIENFTHDVIEDTKIKKVTSWRKSKTKFLQSLIFNILSLGIIHILSLFYPNLYVKLYCNKRNPKECDFFLVEDIYGNLTLCKKIYKKDKGQNALSSNHLKDTTLSSSLSNYNDKLKKDITKNLTYSFKYRSVTYEYNEQTNEIIPVYMNLLNLTCKDIFHCFSEGLSSEKSVNIFLNRYGKNEYNLDFKMVFLYFFQVEIPNIILVLIIAGIEISLYDYISFFAKLAIIIILLSAEFINIKLSVYNKYKREYTLDGEKKKIRVKRSHKIAEKNSEIFFNIDNCDLLPGDIIFLKSNDIVPCDCLILEGECMANSNNLLGNLNIFRKVSLENKNIPFNYKLNKDNILYHGMKIVKTYSNLKQEYISVLCINTGPNTFKANQYSNALYIFERNNKYKDSYKFFNSDMKSFIYIILAIFLSSILLGVFYMFVLMTNESDILNFKDNNKIKLFISIIVRVFCKSIMPMYYLLESYIILIGIIKLKNENIFTFDKSKLLNSSSIDTLFIGKTGSLCDDKYEINGYHPIWVNYHNINNLSFKTYNKNQNKEINLQLVKFYKNYLKQNGEHFYSTKIDNKEKTNLKCYEYSTLFLESLLSCNNLEKYGMEIFGNSIDLEIFKSMKWDIKSDNNYINNINSDLDYQYNKFDIDSEYSKLNFFEKSKNDIFPNNYYKITESIKKENKNEIKNSNNSINFTKLVNKIKNEEEKNEKRDSLFTNNTIENDISESHINSYKLRIYKRFIKNGELSSSAITYNFITKELRFNTKGIPEEILDKCNPYTIPDNFYKIISFYRRKGFIIIICASKKINMEEYSEFDTEDKYMNNLNFYGFVTLKNKLKDEVIYALNDLRLYKCNFVISTGDNIYNTLSIGFESTILENKDIYLFDKDEIKNRIIIKKIYNSSNNSYKNEEEEDESTSINEFTKRNSKNKLLDISNKSAISRLKQNKIYDNCDSNLNGLLLKSEKKLEQLFLSRNNSRNNSINTKHNLSQSSTPKNMNFKKSNVSNLSNISNMNLNYVENPKNSINTSGKNLWRKLQMVKKISNNFDFNGKKINQINNDNTNGFMDTLYYYQGIFDDHNELNEDCIYCISGKVFDFLYQNKTKRNSKILLDKIYQKCRIFFNMTSLSKSKVIDYYRETSDNCICTIGECQSDIDSIITSNIGINLQPPKNYNTILSHFYSSEENLLIIKKILKTGRAIKENNSLMKISCCIYTLITNSYILTCFIREMDIIQGQLNFMEISFLILSIAAFTAKYDNDECASNIIRKKNFYVCHNILQISGLLLIKAIAIFFHGHVYHSNDILTRKEKDKIYVTFYFLFCIEQLFSTIMVLNFISFYRISWFFNTFFIIFCLIIFLYFTIIVTLTSSNYNIDIFKFLYFEHIENIVDAYDENNKFKIFMVCFCEFIISIIYSTLIYLIFYQLTKNNHNSNKS